MPSNPKRKLVYGTDDEYGVQGLRPAEHGTFNYLDGMGVAHDLLEHFPNDPGDIAGELEALGASMFVRGDNYLSNRGRGHQTWAENIASDMPNLYRHIMSEQYPIGRLDQKAPRASSDAYFDEETFIQECDKLARSEFDDESDTERFVRFYKDAVPWIRAGAQRAARRYAAYGPVHMCNLFIAIEDQVNKSIKELQDMGAEGAEVHVNYNIKTNNVQVWADMDGERYDL